MSNNYKKEEVVKKPKVMIIDDSVTIRKTAEIFLTQANFEVVLVENGYEALSKIIDEKPDILFIDVIMPKLDGYQTCKIIKQHPDFVDLPIIILSSKDGVIDKAKGKFIGSDEYLTKPFSKDGLIEAVRKHLNM